MENTTGNKTDIDALPESCFVIVRGNVPGKRIGQVVRGESGYYATTEPMQLLAQDEAAVELFVDEVNLRDNVTPQQRKAMECGSMFGWDVPAAKPSNWINK